MTPFRLGILGFCVAIAVLALMVFSGAIPSPWKKAPKGPEGDVVVWGTLPNPTIDKYFNDLNQENKDRFNIKYVLKDSQSISSELVDALARGQGPDLVLLPHESILKEENKFFLVPYTFLPEDIYNQTFAPGAQLFKRGEGVVAMPLFIDPMVMYYNDDLLAKSNVALPPRFWVDVSSSLSDSALKKITQVDDRNNIHQSFIALGGFDNITHAKDILSLLIMQAGDQIVSGIPGSLSRGLSQASVVVLNFFIQFSNPTQEQYTWSSALPASADSFSSGKLALYLGAASDLARFQKINPHFVPGVTLVPQRDPSANQTFGRFYALAITQSSQHKDAAMDVLSVLTGKEGATFFSQLAGLPPARRDLIATSSNDPSQAVFYRAALSAKAWFDVNPEGSARVFRTMVQNVLSGFEDSSKAVDRAANELLAN